MAPIVNVPAGIRTNSIPTLLVRRGASLAPCSGAGMARRYRVMAAISNAQAAAKATLDVMTRWGGCKLCTLRVSGGGSHASLYSLCLIAALKRRRMPWLLYQNLRRRATCRDELLSSMLMLPWYRTHDGYCA